MSTSPKVEAIAAQILAAFEAGTVPAALAQIFIRHKNNADCPAARWSWRNQLTAALAGHYDARGFRQWQQVGRSVKKGERALYILGPCMVKNKEAETEDDAFRLVGFTAIPVFGYAQTEGEPLPRHEQEDAFIDSLPLVAVARAWNLSVATFNAEGGNRLGSYCPGKSSIALGVENLSTWTHELVHAADDRRGALTRCAGQDLGNEVVAEFGGAVLLEALGYSVESDRGGAYEYIQRYAQKAERDVLSVCTELLDRACAAVALILATADQIQQQHQAA